MDFETFYSKAIQIQWSTVRFAYNGLSLVDVSPLDPQLHRTEAYVLFDMLKQVECADEIMSVPDEDGVNVRCKLLGASVHSFVSACLTYKMFSDKLQKNGQLDSDEVVVYSFAVNAIRQCCPDFNPDKDYVFMLTPKDTLNHE